MATIQDVAAKAGVSVATVSRVINKSGTVAPKSIAKVNEAIHELGYQPNFLARDLRRAETNRVLVLLQTISNPYYATVVKGIEDVAQRQNYSIILCNTDSELEREKNYVELLGRKVVQGAIFLDTEMGRDELNTLAEDNHIVLCCEYKKGVCISHVMIDNYWAAMTMVRHLIALGHRKIALIVGDEHLSSTNLRQKGYMDALKEAGISVREDFIFRGGQSSFKAGMRAVETVFYGPEWPTAIFAMSDVLAIGAINSLSKKGISIPEQVAVAGFDDIEYSSVMIPSLTTIAQPTYDMGCMAMEQLIKEMKNEEQRKKEIILEHELIIRESTVKSIS